ncbi:histidine phosphatase family protein [Carnobacterium sp.]|uniref:histidine phosphatase family protein n=1 Tax=Carnobacterium sp. TaxID=48221 RepID=UPI002FC63004
MAKLYFVRHGKTEWNLAMKLQGSKGDSPLLEESYFETALLGERLKKISFSKVYVSPQKRAIETANVLMEELLIKPEIIQKEGLKEFGLGELEGQLIIDAIDAYPEQMHHLRNNPHEYDPSEFGGETFSEMIKRSVVVVEEAVMQNPNENLLFVGHGATLVALIQTLSGKPLEQIRKAGGLDNSSLSIIEMNELGYELILWNDTSHLDSLN